MKKEDIFNLWKINWINTKIIEEIICKITGLTKSQLFLLSEIDEKYLPGIKDKFYRLQNFEPIQYVLNESEFMWNNFYVDKRVLIPRDDTEVLIKAIENWKWKIEDNLSFIDVWTWTWIIPTSIIKRWKLKIKSCFAIDISKDALEVAKINVKKYNLEDKVKLLHWNLLKSFIKNSVLNSQFSSLIITANLPYIKEKDYKNMDNSVIDYEPDLALYWWKDTGFELYEKLIEQCILLKSISLKVEAITLFIEIWFDQYEVSNNFLQNKWLSFEYFKDTNDINRCIRVDF